MPEADEHRRKRLLVRCRNRGMLETSLLLRRFADAALAGLSEEELDRLEILLDAPDDRLWNWINGHDVPPPEIDRALLARVKNS